MKVSVCGCGDATLCINVGIVHESTNGQSTTGILPALSSTSIHRECLPRNQKESGGMTPPTNHRQIVLHLYKQQRESLFSTQHVSLQNTRCIHWRQLQQVATSSAGPGENTCHMHVGICHGVNATKCAHMREQSMTLTLTTVPSHPASLLPADNRHTPAVCGCQPLPRCGDGCGAPTRQHTSCAAHW